MGLDLYAKGIYWGRVNYIGSWCGLKANDLIILKLNLYILSTGILPWQSLIVLQEL